MSENKMMSLREFSEIHNCRYGAFTETVKRLRKTNTRFNSHVTGEWSRIILDDNAVMMLCNEKMCSGKTVKGEAAQEEYEKLLEKRNRLTAEKKANDERQRALSAEIRKNESAIRALYMEQITGGIYKILGREYISGDEIRLTEFLTDNEDFKTAMNKNMEV